MNDPETPWSARWLFRLAAAYLVSPIDLIPNWIPVIGVLDDVVIVPSLVYLAFKLIPTEVVTRQMKNATPDVITQS